MCQKCEQSFLLFKFEILKFQGLSQPLHQAILQRVNKGQSLLFSKAISEAGVAKTMVIKVRFLKAMEGTLSGVLKFAYYAMAEHLSVVFEGFCFTHTNL